MDLLKRIFRKILRKLNLFLPLLSTNDEINIVYNFFYSYNDFRNLYSCSKETGLTYYKCARIKRYLYNKRKLGLYFFEAKKPPQKYMRKHVLERINWLNQDSRIVEVGPGEHPIFDYLEYKNWLGVDRNFDGNQINFKELEWANGRYVDGKMVKGAFENLSDCLVGTGFVGSTDLVVASHVYEHTLLPIKSLCEINKVLRPGGVLVLFVPDGFVDDVNTKDPTHTLYLNKEMIEEFFAYAGGYSNLEIKTFRPNADFIITAVKI